MFRRHRTEPGREVSSVVLAFHGRLAGMLATPSPGPRADLQPRDRLDLRGRLAGPAAIGLRDRIERGITA